MSEKTVTEQEIRPAEIFDRFLELAKQDVETFFGKATTSDIVCPACGTEGEKAFEKNGFNYDLCPDCRTLYVSPRPAREAFDAYYCDSPSTKYWADVFYKATAEARREKLWKPKAAMVNAAVEKYQTEAGTIADIGGGFGIFAEEMSKLSNREVVIIEPSVHLAEACRRRGLKVVQHFLEDVSAAELPEVPLCFTSFELFEHLYDPRAFLNSLCALMKPGDMFLFTTLSGAGLDIQILWDKAKAVCPPVHLNFFNPWSIRRLMADCGYEVLEITTPGKLDLDILTGNREHVRDRFWSTVLDLATPEEQQQIQQSISANLLSSHMMVVARKNNP